MDGNFCFQEISSIGWSKMGRDPKQGSHLQWQEIITLICQWWEWRHRGPQSKGLRAWQIAIARSTITLLQCPHQSPTCVALHWLVVWGVMGLRKVAIVLCWWACVLVACIVGFSLYLLSSSKNGSNHHWSLYSMILQRRVHLHWFGACIIVCISKFH